MRKHSAYYICLIGVSALAVLLISHSGADKKLQMTVVVFLSFFYFLWGILHHIVHHNLRLKIVVEYALVALLGASVILFILKGFS